MKDREQHESANSPEEYAAALAHHAGRTPILHTNWRTSVKTLPDGRRIVTTEVARSSRIVTLPDGRRVLAPPDDQPPCPDTPAD